MTRTNSSVLLATFLLSAAATAAFAPAARANHDGGGTIYFIRYAGTGELTFTMNSDGGAKSALPAVFWSSPSRALHGGHRWFLDERLIPGETYPSGDPRRELFAVRDDADETFAVRLTDQADLEGVGDYFTYARWMPGDGSISWVARRWADGAVLEGGIYSASVVYDGSGNITGLVSQPAAPTLSADLVPTQNDGLWPDVLNHDWSPTADRVAHVTRLSPSQLRVTTLLTGVTLVLDSRSNDCVWSPDGSRIAYTAYPPLRFSEIRSISPNGSGRKTLAKGTPSVSIENPMWSPTGSHLVYLRWDRVGEEFDVYRMTSNGGGPTNLTGDIPSVYSPQGWR